MFSIITYTILNTTVKILPYSRTKGTAEGTITDDNDMFCGGNFSDCLLDRAMRDLAFVWSPDKEAVCIDVEFCKFLRRKKGVGR